MRVPMLNLGLEYEYMRDAIDGALKRCLTHQKWIFGPEVAELEGAVARYLGAPHCVGVSSGTEALVLALRALAIVRKGEEYFDRGDLIVTTPFTFTATGDAIVRAGATPLFVDIDMKSYNLDLSKVRDCLKSAEGSGVVGIVPVHLYGRPVEMDELRRIAAEFNLFVVEDVAQAFGGSWDGRKLGTLGDLGAFSFFPSKNLGGFGDGGMVCTGEAELAEIVRMLLRHGGKDKYNVDHVGYNARLDTIQAAVVLAKLPYLDEFNARRRDLALKYTGGLDAVSGLHLPCGSNAGGGSTGVAAPPGHVFHQYTVRTEKRDGLQAFLGGKGVGSMVYYPYPLHRMRVFEGRMKTWGDLGNAERAAAEVLSLPMEPLQTAEETEMVISGVRAFFEGGR